MEAKDYVLALKERGLTQTQIGEGCGIPQPTISKIERGDVADVMSKNYRALQALYEKVMAEPIEPVAPAESATAATEKVANEA